MINFAESSDFMQVHEILSLVEIVGPEKLPEFKEQMACEPTDPFVRGTLQRAGRAGFYYWLQNTREVFSWDNPLFRFSPVKKKITSGLQQICEVFSTQKEIPVTLENKLDRWEIELSIDPLNTQKITPLVVYYLAGFIQEFSSWAGLGKFYRVIPTEPGQGNLHCCSISLFKEPIDS